VKWDKESLEKVTTILADLPLEKWREFSQEMDARDAITSSWAATVWPCPVGTAHISQGHDPKPAYLKLTNKVVIRNPFPHHHFVIATTPYIEVDADMAMKVLVLGGVP
jgi:hypothetical protein